MTDWRFYSVILHVSLLPISRAGAVEVSLSPSSLAWYFEFLETYVFPFILAASVALLIGYGISRLFRGREKELPEFADQADGTPDAPDVPNTDIPDIDAPVPPAFEAVQAEDAALAEDTSPRLVMPAAEDAPPPVAPEVDDTIPVMLNAAELTQRISNHVSERGVAALNMENLAADAPSVEAAEALVQRIGVQATEQASIGANGRSGSADMGDDSRGNKLDTILQRISGRSADDAVSAEPAANGEAVQSEFESVEEAVPEPDPDPDQSPADRLDALLQRISGDKPETPMDAPENRLDAPPPGVIPDESPADRLDSLIQRIGARASGQATEAPDDRAEGTLPGEGGDQLPADKLDALMQRIGSDVPEEAPTEETPTREDTAVEASHDEAVVDGVEEFVRQAPDEFSDFTTDAEEETVLDAPVEPDLEALETDSGFEGSVDERAATSTEPAFGPPEDETSADPVIDMPPEPELMPLDQSVADLSLEIEPESDASFEPAMDEPIDVEFEPATEPMMESPLEIGPESPTGPVMDAPVDIEPEPAFNSAQEEPIDFEAGLSDDAAMDTLSETERERSAEPPPDAPSLAPGSESTEAPELDMPAMPEPFPDPEVLPMEPVMGSMSDMDAVPAGEQDSGIMPVELEPGVRAKDDGLTGDTFDAGMDMALQKLSGSVRDASVKQVSADEAGSTPRDEMLGTNDSGPLADSTSEPIAPAAPKGDPQAAAQMAVNIVDDFERIAAALRRFIVVIEEYESSREGLDVDAVESLYLERVEMPAEAESILQRLGENVPGDAMAGYELVAQFNHIIDQLAQMARDASLDEGWNELLHNRIADTAGSIGEICERIRAAVPG